MQPAANPEDIHTILGRFHTWAGKNPGNGNGKSAAPETEGVREIPYEEAMRNFRRRHKTPTRRPSPAAEPPATSPAASQTALLKQEEPLPSSAAPDPLPETPLSATPEVQFEDRLPLSASPVPAAKAVRAPSPEPKKCQPKKASRPAKNLHAEPVTRALVPAKPSQLAPLPKVQPKPKRRAAPAKKSTALALRPSTAGPKAPVFRNVLAKTVRTASASVQNTRKAVPKPDRSRRVTTRFSAAEQRRLERAAAEAGLTVSAWLRQCALRAETASAPLPAPAPSRKKRAAAPAPQVEPALFSTPAPSGLGSWLTLLRQRFLSSPARFSERA
jgi:hypothetical protein